MSTYQLDLQPVGLRIPIAEEMPVLAAAQKAGIEIIALCGGEGWCGKCKVQHIEGDLTPPTMVEMALLTKDELTRGVRLACQVRLAGNAAMFIPPASLSTFQRLQTEGNEVEIPLDTAIERVPLQLHPPNGNDLEADVSRLQKALAERGYPEIQVPLPVLQELSNRMRKFGWQFDAVLRQKQELVTILPTGTTLLGFAADIGTTKIAGYLIDLTSGKTLAKAGISNPQIPYGEDVISRIHYANQHAEGAAQLQRCLIEQINSLIAQLCRQTGSQPQQIVDSVFVGNTVIHHLLLGIPVAQLGEAPFVAAVSSSIDCSTTALDLNMAPGAYLYLPPNIAGYVGADHTAVLAATQAITRANEKNETLLVLDIGTNTEISLLHQGRLLSCSCASGPAFEGAHITHGIRAIPGAIESIRIESAMVIFKTIENTAPIGICGSGILDAVAELSRNGFINANGQLKPGIPRLTPSEGANRAFILASAAESGTGQEIVITRKDINEIQLAKGAIRTGIEILLHEAGIGSDQLDRFIIAGAFGTYLDIDNTIAIGMFPNLPTGKFEQVGNAAGIGAKMLLLSQQLRNQAARMIEQEEYIELTVYPRFQEIYVNALLIPQEKNG